MPKKTVAQFKVEYLQVMDEKGKVDKKLLPKIPKEKLVGMYKTMVLARRFDAKMLAMQRQGRIATFAQVEGQEAAQIGAVAALTDDDWVIPAFREIAAWIYRGVPLKNMLLYNGGDERGAFVDGAHDMPIAIPVCSQTTHAAGIAWGMKLKKAKTVAICFFGDGATSEGDFHDALNFSGVNKAPAIFLCQNNQFAISTSRKIQTAAETIAQKGIAYGIHCVQVDGNDVFSVYAAVSEAAKRARKGEGPTLIEAITYRLANHTTADDATRYRKKSEVVAWMKKDPIPRLKNYLVANKMWSEKDEKAFMEDIEKQIAKAIKEFENIGPLDLEDIFKYQYAEMTPQLKEQLEYLKGFEKK